MLILTEWVLSVLCFVVSDEGWQVVTLTLIIIGDPPVAFYREVVAGEGDIKMDVWPVCVEACASSGVQHFEVEFINRSTQLFASMVVLGSSPESVLGIHVAAYNAIFGGKYWFDNSEIIVFRWWWKVDCCDVDFLFNCANFNWDAFYFVRDVEGSFIWDVLFNEDRPSSFSAGSWFVLDIV